MMNNADWLEDLNYIQFLRDIGRYFSVNRKLTFEGVKQRWNADCPSSSSTISYFRATTSICSTRTPVAVCRWWRRPVGNIVAGIDLICRWTVPNVMG